MPQHTNAANGRKSATKAPANARPMQRTKTSRLPISTGKWESWKGSRFTCKPVCSNPAMIWRAASRSAGVPTRASGTRSAAMSAAAARVEALSPRFHHTGFPLAIQVAIRRL